MLAEEKKDLRGRFQKRGRVSTSLTFLLPSSVANMLRNWLDDVK
jgi:hypothetical protein